MAEAQVQHAHTRTPGHHRRAFSFSGVRQGSTASLTSGVGLSVTAIGGLPFRGERVPRLGDSERVRGRARHLNRGTATVKDQNVSVVQCRLPSSDRALRFANRIDRSPRRTPTHVVLLPPPSLCGCAFDAASRCALASRFALRSFQFSQWVTTRPTIRY